MEYIFLFLVLVAVAVTIKNKLAAKSNDSGESRSQIGEVYEEFVGNHFRQQGYKVDMRGKRLGYLDRGVDIFAEKEDEALLLQCKYWMNKKVTMADVKVANSDCYDFIHEHELLDKYKKVNFLFVLPKYERMGKDVLGYFKSGKRIRYKVLPME